MIVRGKMKPGPVALCTYHFPHWLSKNWFQVTVVRS